MAIIHHILMASIFTVGWLSTAEGRIMEPQGVLNIWTRPGIWVNSDQINQTGVFSAAPVTEKFEAICRVLRSTATEKTILTGWTYSTISCSHTNLNGTTFGAKSGVQVLKEETPGTFKWKFVPKGEMCDGAVVGGMTQEREPTYICRVGSKGELQKNWIVIGMLVPSKGKCYIGYSNKAESYDTYEILYDNRY